MNYTARQIEIKEGNDIIAAFVGLEIKIWNACFAPPTEYWCGNFLEQVRRSKSHYTDLINRGDRATELHFHEYFDWLIPAVTKFKNTEIFKVVLNNEKEHRVQDIMQSVAENDMDSSFDKLVKHIKWYNPGTDDLTEQLKSSEIF